MMKSIKQGENIGVAKQVQGVVVDVYPHPRFRGMYGFVYKGEKWTCNLIDYFVLNDGNIEESIKKMENVIKKDKSKRGITDEN